MAVDGTLPPARETHAETWIDKTGAFFKGIPSFYQAVVAEMKKVTWPEVVDVRRATVAIIIFVLLLGLFIWILDTALGAILGKLIPSLFVGGR